jgi:hypothetical protein
MVEPTGKQSTSDDMINRRRMTASSESVKEVTHNLGCLAALRSSLLIRHRHRRLLRTARQARRHWRNRIGIKKSGFATHRDVLFEWGQVSVDSECLMTPYGVTDDQRL